MRQFLLTMLMLGLIAGLVFANGAQESGDGEAPQELRVMWWGAQRRHEITIDVVELYGETNDVEMTYEFAGFSDYWTKLSTMAAGGNLPDIMQLGYPHLSDWQSRGMLQQLDSYADQGVLDFTNVPASSLSGGRIDGDLYAVSLGVNTWAFVADTDMFERAGVSLPGDDWTWEDFEQTVLDLHESLGFWGMGAGLPNPSAIELRALYLSSGIDAVDVENGRLAYSDDTILVEYLNRLLRLQEAGAITPISVQASDYAYGENPEMAPIVEGEAAMSFLASNQLVAQWNAAGGAEERNFTLLPIPRTGANSANWLRPSMMFAVTTDSEIPEVAADFISFFINDIEANRILQAERGVPVATNIRDDLSAIVDEPARVVFDFVGRIAEDSIPIPPPTPQGWNDLISNVWQPVVRDEVLFGETSPEAAARIFREEAEEILD